MFTPSLWIFMLVTLGLAALLTWPMIARERTKAWQTSAISSLRGIGFAMFEFETAYGSFPDSVTAPLVTARSKSHLDLSGNAANDYFRQLLAANVITYETVFHAVTAFSKKPDNRFDSTETALAPGEVGFGDLMNGKSALASKGNPARPLACAPLAYDGKTVSDRRFDPSMYDGKAVILRIDNSVTSLFIDPGTGSLRLKQGRDLLETGPESVWGDDVTPVIVPPLP